MEIKSLAITAAQIKLANDGEGTFSGYASSFNNVDSYGDTIIKGAYAETLKVNGLPKMFFNHDMYAVPIGKWIDAKEDDYGLLLTGQITPGNAQGQEVYAALKHGTVDGMSIGYSLTKGDYDEVNGGRKIRKVARLRETSLVTFPADKFAKVNAASVKTSAEELEEIKTIRDFEYFMRDACGLSKGAAQALTARAKALFAVRDAGDEGEAKKLQGILDRLQKIAA